VTVRVTSKLTDELFFSYQEDGMTQQAVTNDPPSQEIVINTSSAKNRKARPNPYVDQSLTLENVDSSPAAALDVPPASGSTTTGWVRQVYANDQLPEIQNDEAAEDNTGVPALPPIDPPGWGIETDTSIPGAPITRSRDPYRNNGMDPYMQNNG
jgi:hypothetical protein